MKYKVFIAVILFACMAFSPIAAQEYADTVKMDKIEIEQNTDSVCLLPEEDPEFPGGMEAMFQFILENLQYPNTGEDVEGTIIVSFIVEKDGSLTNIEISRRVYPFLDKEALRVVKLMPKWIPGKQDGKAVRVKYTIPIIFRL